MFGLSEKSTLYYNARGGGKSRRPLRYLFYRRIVASNLKRSSPIWPQVMLSCGARVLALVPGIRPVATAQDIAARASML